MTQTIEAIRKKYNLPALAVVVVKDGAICDRVAVGVRKLRDATPVTIHDQFHIGSITKSMTATLAGILIDEGQLSWDTTIADVFPELKGQIWRQYENVTMEQLLTHRGGIPRRPPAEAWRQAWKQQGTPTEQRRQYIEAVLSNPSGPTPGMKMIYSNHGYAVAGAVLEKFTATSWENLMTRRLFGPLHMDTAGFGPPGTPGNVDQPWGHLRMLFAASSLQKDNPPAISPAGRVHCSLEDLARYTIFHMRNQPALLEPETLAQLHTPGFGGDYACGWRVVRRRWAGGTALSHNGSNTMWFALAWLAPEKDFSVVVATNIGGWNADYACDDASEAMIRYWLDNKS